MEKQASIISYLSSASFAVFGGITLQEVAVVVGIITALGTFVINWYYKAREDKRAEARK